jgi:hypothetical protein
VFLLSGCYVPYDNSVVIGFYARKDAKQRTEEVVEVMLGSHGWTALVTPEGPQPVTFHGAHRYYLTDRHVRRRTLPFLTGDVGAWWEIIVPVEGTNCWVQLQGPHKRIDPVPGKTNLLITVFTSRQLLYRQEIVTKERAVTNYLHFADGNREIRYKSEREEFAYHVLENRLLHARE